MPIEDATVKQEASFNALLLRTMFSEAYTVAYDFRRCVTLQGQGDTGSANLHRAGSLLQRLYDHQDVPQIVKAKAIGDLAEIAEESGDLATCFNLENTASHLFETFGHAHAALDIGVREVCRKMRHHGTDAKIDLEKEVDLFKVYVKGYEETDFVHGTHNAHCALLASIPNSFYFDFQLALVGVCQELAKQGGAKLLWFLHYAGALAQWLVHSGRAARIVEGANAIYEEIRSGDCKWLIGFISYITGQAYLQLHDLQNALHWTAICKSTWETCSPFDRAEAVTLDLHAKLRIDSDEKATEAIIQSTDGEVEQNIKNGLIKQAVDQLDWIITIIFIPRHDARTVNWLERMESLVRRLPNTDADLKLANLYQAHGVRLLDTFNQDPATSVEEEAVRMLEMAIPLYLKHKRLYEAANTRQMHGMVIYRMYQKSPTLQLLHNSFEKFQIANDLFRTLDITSQISTSSYWCAFMAYQAWIKGWFDRENVLKLLTIAKNDRDQERIELSIFGGLKALSEKQTFGASTQVQYLFEMAMHVCVKWPILPETLWQWVQKAKARSLSDILGLEVLVPKALLSEISEDNRMKDLFHRERTLLLAIKKADMTSRLSIRGELHSVQKQMREYPMLKATMDLRDGIPVSLAQLHDIAAAAASNSFSNHLVFVDWVFSEDCVYICTVKDQGMPLVNKCDITRHEIEAWKQTYLDLQDGRSMCIGIDGPEENSPNHPFRQIDALVEPLLGVIDDLDLLICSVTGVLHSIPIHALWIKNSPLIVWNPIVYTASMTTFAQCFHRAEQRKAEKGSTMMMAVYEPSPDTDFHPKEQQDVYDSIRDLAMTKNAYHLVGRVERTIFEASIQSSTLFHFHGHCKLNKVVITDQSLVLADGDFSIKDIFKMNLPAPHITLIACDSASQGINAGDEPLGIVTALLCTGASSALGTIWPTASGTGRNFSKHFYVELGSNSEASVFDLASALRTAVLKIRRNRRTRLPYHWASFVLHGAWFTKSS